MNKDKIRVQEIIRQYEKLSYDKELQEKYADKIDAELCDLFDRNGEDVAQEWVDEVLDVIAC